MKKARLILAFWFIVPLCAQSQKEKDAAQHARDIATIERLQRQNDAAAAAAKTSASNGAAIAKLGVDNKNRAAVATDEGNTHAEEAKAAVASVQQAASDVADTAQSTRVEVERLRAALPINSVTVWLAAIAGIVTVLGTIGSIVLAFVNRSKINEVHQLTNSNLAKITTELQIANERIAGLREQVNYSRSLGTTEAAVRTPPEPPSNPEV